MNKAYFAAGCFWSPEEHFRKLPGVLETAVGYSGGIPKNPTYELVCSGGTGHAETVEVVFDPSQITFKELLQQFFSIHNPTQGNRQGPDVGSQYRSAIFYTDDEQKQMAEAVRDEVQKQLNRPVTTELAPLDTFWKGEEYHQKYYAKKGGGACHL